MDITLTKENLEYVAFVAKKYCNLCGKGWEEIVVVNALDIFQHRVDLIECASNYDLYKNIPEIQTTIENYGYNADAFWLLLLFLKDYTESCFGDSFDYDTSSIGDNIKKMITMLESPTHQCLLTISNEHDSAQIPAILINQTKYFAPTNQDEEKNNSTQIPEILIINGLKELLLTVNQRDMTAHQSIGIKRDNIQWHKTKFFMDMLDYFLKSYALNPEMASKRKNWIFIAQALYLVGYLTDKKYLYGYERTERTKKDIDGKITVSEEITPLKGLGKYLTDNTKHLKDTANRQKSTYCYKNYLDLID